MKLLAFMYIFTAPFVLTLSVRFERNLHYINNNILTNSKTNNKPTKYITSLYNHNEQTYLQKAQAGISHIRKNLGKGFGKGINSFAIAIIFLALTSVTGLFYKNQWKEAGTPSGSQKELFKYRCVKCNMVMFPAEGREQKFLKKSFICPNCGQSNMDKHLSKK
ncbi:conserved Plasmodium protein, unknown function [Plasmodium ovale wallikeri]|uniref:Rubredoxin-like domain-containing protein n=1 Tax=Plasmodium ovale wallikeri TaxID=864142 RepID=A0A1A8Z7L0_PLAOA|nr:conserved Plasmodium protein, unknown function [Plasmodium ovale wallikeri]SBT45197.1 conserved Plasmodium protein, unknown function [Plasmodium ovale wallikeri]